MKTYNKIVTGLLLVLLSLTLGACGSDVDKEVVVTFTLVALAGPAVDIGAVDYDIDLPTGFALATEADGVTPAAGVVNVVAGGFDAVNYTPEVPPAPGELAVGIISATGFTPGVMFTVVKSLAEDEPLPVPADFVEVQLDVYDVNDATVTPLPPADYSMTVDVQKRVATL
jgi:hypothetical protein